MLSAYIHGISAWDNCIVNSIRENQLTCHPNTEIEIFESRETVFGPSHFGHRHPKIAKVRFLVKIGTCKKVPDFETVIGKYLAFYFLLIRPRNWSQIGFADTGV